MSKKQEEVKNNTSDNADELMKRKNKSLKQALKNASAGILTASQTERNIRIQFILIIFALILGAIFKLTETEFVLVVISIFFVIFAEMINTAIEAVVDLYVDVFHSKAKVAKDVAAGAVVIASLNSIIVAYFVFFQKIATFGLKTLVKFSSQNPTVFFISLMIFAIITVIAIKTISSKILKDKFIPSGQMIVGSAIFMAIWSQTQNKIIITSALILLMLLALNRIGKSKRSVLETTVGAMIGIALAIAVYVIFKMMR